MTTSAHSSELVWAFSERPPRGRRLLLLTAGDVCVIGDWCDTAGYKAWCNPPAKSAFHAIDFNAPSNAALILNPGGVIIIGPPNKNSDCLGWHELPRHIPQQEIA